MPLSFQGPPSKAAAEGAGGEARGGDEAAGRRPTLLQGEDEALRARGRRGVAARQDQGQREFTT